MYLIEFYNECLNGKIYSNYKTQNLRLTIVIDHYKAKHDNLRLSHAMKKPQGNH